MVKSRRVLVSGGPIHILDGTTPVQEAMVVDNGRVVAIGSADDMKSVAGSGSDRFDLDGASAMPGIVDSHPHFLHFSAFEEACVNILDARNHKEIVERIRERAKTTPKGQWIITTPVGEPHYFIRRWYTDLEERRMPDRHVLDQATTDHPVLIQAWAPRTPNIVAFNSMGLRMAGISSITPDQVCSVRIEKDDARVPTGILRGPVVNYYTEDPFWLEILSRLPPPNESIWRSGALAAQKAANKLGVTACYEAHGMDPEHIEAYRSVRNAGESTMRVLNALEIVTGIFDPHYKPTNEEVIARLALALSLTETKDDLFRCNGASLARGGPCWPGYLRIYDEMKTPTGGLTRGKTFVSQEIEKLVIEYCLDNNIRLNMVQGAYRDHDEFFESIAPFESKYDIPSRKWISQHNILTTEAQCGKLAELGMDITTSLSFVWGKGDIYGERIGQQCWKDLIPMRRFIDSGATVACGSDWGPKNIFHHIALAETHQFAGSGHCIDDHDHKITREESLLTWTRNSAKVMQWDDIGSLLPGYHADITIIDRDPLSTPVDEMEGTVVLKTILGGKVVYENGGLGDFPQA